MIKFHKNKDKNLFVENLNKLKTLEGDFGNIHVKRDLNKEERLERKIGLESPGYRGIFFYTRIGINSTELDLGIPFKEYICIKIESCSLELLFLVIYRSPNSDIYNNEQLFAILKSIFGLKGLKIVIGDFNMIKGATRYRASQTQNLLHLLLVQYENIIKEPKEEIGYAGVPCNRELQQSNRDNTRQRASVEAISTVRKGHRPNNVVAYFDESRGVSFENFEHLVEGN
ncbi:hypothetical protein HELRODRAFT_178226 [Helobdella robusta]|uniref:Endonuclease/exonuclease/phosphatase domain-containing protein n=1 Tax=Helobdella robusta TaxID=6412 RepID=T1FCY7_HELRO|nr:hypothetical protein HELRODRAFT_178226 [Helobdella robusta]ESN97431.1 hypothetical protein HELRODRAFT_178226 [Helobdella robusta]